MPKAYFKHTIEEYLNALASDAPSPGGGSAAALTAATACALLEMTARINDKRAKKTRDHSKVSAARARFGELMDEDTAAFLALSAFKKEERESDAYQKAVSHAAVVPLEICTLSAGLLKAAEAEIPLTSAWLMSDLEESVLLFRSAIRAAKFNVDINLKSVIDSTFAEKLRRELSHCLEACQ